MAPTKLGRVWMEQLSKTKLAGAKATNADIKGKIVEYAFWLKREGYAETTIITRVGILRVLLKRGANLLNPENVKQAIADQKWSKARKMNAVYTYDGFLATLGMAWEPPTYIPTRTMPFIPTEQEIYALIAGYGKKMSTILQLLKETAMRAGEARELKWTDVDMLKKVIRVNAPEKNSNPRVFRVGEKLISMLNSLPKKSLKVFGNTARATDNKNFHIQRKRIARKLNNSRLLQIHFHTLRHWKATTLYHQTKDIIYVKEFLGHKRIDTTLKYIQIEKAYFGPGHNDEFTCKIAKTPEEIKELIEAGFEYVTELNEDQFFRKRK